MGFVEGVSREQVVLFPEAIEDYVKADNPVRFIDAFVTRLDLGGLGFSRSEPQELGRPAYDPRDLLKLYIYGYVNEIRSSRKLERESQRNLELVWLLRRLAPDHKTIANFRRTNSKALREVFRSFTKLCKELKLYGAQLVGIDGSKFRAVNGRERNFNRAKLQQRLEWIEARIEKYLAALERTDAAERNEPQLTAAELEEKIKQLRERQEHYQELQTKLAESGEKQISLTDAEARLMKGRQGHHVSYNVQAAVDDKHKLVATFAVTNEENDVNCLADMAQAAKEELGVSALKACADRGYYNTAQVKKCEEADIEVYMELRRPRQPDGIFPLERFVYDAARDVYECPAGKLLSYRVFDKTKQLRSYWTEACQRCPMRAQCTTGKGPRKIRRAVGQDATDRMLQRVRQQPEVLRLRKQLVEHPFGTIKRWMRQDHFLTRGGEKVTGEMSLTFLAYNLKRVITLKGIPELLAQLPAIDLKEPLPAS